MICLQAIANPSASTCSQYTKERIRNSLSKELMRSRCAVSKRFLIWYRLVNETVTTRRHIWIIALVDRILCFDFTSHLSLERRTPRTTAASKSAAIWISSTWLEVRRFRTTWVQLADKAPNSATTPDWKKAWASTRVSSILHKWSTCSLKRHQSTFPTETRPWQRSSEAHSQETQEQA